MKVPALLPRAGYLPKDVVWRWQQFATVTSGIQHGMQYGIAGYTDSAREKKMVTKRRELCHMRMQGW